MSTGNGTAPAPPVRNDYREGQVLRARDLERESGYFLARDRQHAALAHIPGILRGLRLQVFERGTETVVDEASLAGKKEPTRLDVFLEAGVAVDGYGRLVGVPRREQLRAELATSPSLLRSGRYRLELLYDRTTEGGGAGPNGGDGCGGASAGGGAGRMLREGYRLRLVKADPALEPPGIGAVLDGPPDAPEAEAPVALGTVDWDGVDSFVGFSLQQRVYAGVRAEVVAAPDERAELDLRDAAGRIAVRFAAEPKAGGTREFDDAVRIDDQGCVWVRGTVDVGPDGVRFRPGPAAVPENRWGISLVTTEKGGAFREDDAGEKVKPPEYFPGDRELRVTFERSDPDPTGRRRVLIGHADSGGNFQPAVAVYDRPPEAGQGFATVEVWGDLHVLGTTFLTGVQRAGAGSPPAGGDELDLLLRQMAGPLAGLLRNFLTSDPDWLAHFADILVGSPAFIGKVAEQLSIGDVATTVVNLIATDGAVAQTVADAVTRRVQATTATGDVMADAVARRFQAVSATGERVADAVFDQVEIVTKEFAGRLANALILKVSTDAQVRRRLNEALSLSPP